MGRIAVLSCSHYAWIESSRYMGENLAHAIGEGTEMHVHTPVDKKGLIACLEGANYAIIHVHGTPERLIDQRESKEYKLLTTIGGLKDFPEFPNLRLIVMTACSTAGGENDKNIASELSKHIAKDGLVIANRFDTYGACYDFGERYGKLGWVAYQNGKLVITEDKIPARITMADGYNIFLNYRKKLI